MRAKGSMEAGADLISAMPELAEVEFFRRRWDPGLGGVVSAVELHKRKRIFRGSDPDLLERAIAGQRLLRSSARGKQMLFQFSGGNWLGIHLGMSGKLRAEPAGFDPGKHDHLVLRQKQRALVFTDPRQFGRVRFYQGKQAPDWWEASAPEIVSQQFTRSRMEEFLSRHRRAPIKPVLLLQAGFPGIGNWMADEILWRARISPRRKTGSLSEKKLAGLYRSARFVSRESLRTIGRNDSDAPKSWLLHERWSNTGRCPRHGTTLRRASIGGRTTAWCPRCQR